MADDKRLAQPEDGTEQKVDDQELVDELLVRAKRDSQPYLLRVSEGSAAKFVKERWARMDKQLRTLQNELRVNWKRFSGEAFAQIHPTDPNRIFVPANAKSRMPPSVNKIRRTVHRYVSQVTADEPILEGVPSVHTPDARDGAESATLALRGEWHRMNLNRKLQRAQEVAAVMRSGFWFLEWDPVAGGKSKAQKFFGDESGRKVLSYVDSSGNKVADAEDAASVWQGEVSCEVLLPFNVRWSGGEGITTADEVMVGKIITLGQLYEISPKARDAKIKYFVGSVSSEQREWMHEMRGAGGLATRNDPLQDDELERTGHTVTEVSSLLDEPVLLVHYFKRPSRDYPKGVHIMSAGDFTVYRGALRYGRVPVVQFKCLDDIKDPLGVSLVDLLKDPQELIDFVNGQVLRFLQMMRRRWFVPLTSGVNSRDLLNPTRSIIHYNSNSEPPTPEQVPELPRSLDSWLEKYNQEFNDQSAIHDTMQGKHVPGVSSGRHAEALRSGDETILGLTRTQIQEGLEEAGMIILAMAQKEWRTERKIRYFSGREYVEKAFSNTDFGSTHTVQLKRGTLLMLTQAQKLETLFSYVEMGALTQDELRKLAPLVDTAGISTTESPHYIRARRENSDFLAGPPPVLKKARKKYEDAMEALASEVQFANDASMVTGPDSQESVELVMQSAQAQMQVVEEEWGRAAAEHMTVMQVWEQAVDISKVHFEEHTEALASKKAETLPVWWVELFSNHAMEHLQAMMPPPEEGEAPPEGAPPA